MTTPRAIANAAGLILIAGILGYGFGRYSLPAEVESTSASSNTLQSKAVDVAHKGEKESRAPAQIVTVTKWLPAKCPTVPGVAPVLVPEVTVTENRGAVIIDKVEDTSATEEVAATSQTQTSTTVTNEQPRLMLQAGAISDLSLRPAYDVGASYRLAGPLWLGAAYHSDKRLEFRVSLTF